MIFFIKFKIVSSMGVVSIFFRTDKKFWHGVFIIFTKVCSLDVRIFDTVIYSLESRSENSQFQPFQMKNRTFYNKGHSASWTRLFHELFFDTEACLFAAIVVDFFCSYKYLKSDFKFILLKGITNIFNLCRTFEVVVFLNFRMLFSTSDHFYIRGATSA